MQMLNAAGEWVRARPAYVPINNGIPPVPGDNITPNLLGPLQVIAAFVRKPALVLEGAHRVHHYRV
jgi:hypothetical protein